MTGTGVAASLTTLVTLGTAQPIRLGLHKRVQRILHRATDHTVQVTFDPLVINRDDIAQRTRCILCHGGSLSLSWLRLATSSSARFGAASPTQLCERFRTSSAPICRIEWMTHLSFDVPAVISRWKQKNARPLRILWIFATCVPGAAWKQSAPLQTKRAELVQ